MLVRLHKAWGDGNVADMENLDKWCECLDTEADRRLLTRLNDDRNPRWQRALPVCTVKEARLRRRWDATCSEPGPAETCSPTWATKWNGDSTTRSAGALGKS